MLSLNDSFSLSQPQSQHTHQVSSALRARVTTPVLSPVSTTLLGLGQGAKLLCGLQMASDFD